MNVLETGSALSTWEVPLLFGMAVWFLPLWVLFIVLLLIILLSL